MRVSAVSQQSLVSPSRGVLVALAGLTLLSSLVLGACAPVHEETKQPVSFADLFGGSNGDIYSRASLEREAQELISACMRAQVWEYMPVEYTDIDLEAQQVEYEQYARERGYGRVWSILYPEEVKREAEEAFAKDVDPNREYVASLSLSEYHAYNESLYGAEEQEYIEEVDPRTGETTTVTFGYGGGCWGEAYNEVENFSTISDIHAYWDAISVHHDDMEEIRLADPRTIAVTEEWSECMKGHGFVFADQTDYYMNGYLEVDNQFSEILQGKTSRQPFDGWSDDEISEWIQTTSQEQKDAYYTELETTPLSTEEQLPALEALLAHEIALATASVVCDEDFRPADAAVRAAVEQEYVQAHEAELRAIAEEFLTIDE